MTLPTLSTKAKAAIAVTALGVSFASGRYSVNQVAVHTVEQKKELVNLKRDEDTHTQTKIVEVKAPDGTDTKTTVISQVKEDDEVERKDEQVKIDQTVTPQSKPNLNISILAGTRLINPDGVPLYGLSLSKQFIGPVRMGLWGLNNGTVGVSLGVDF